jgi:hypothetical protein
LINFLLMVKVVQNPVREPADYLYRDVLLTLAILAASLSVKTRTTSGSIDRTSTWSLPAALILTSVAVSTSFPIFHLREYKSVSPYALVNSLSDTDPWINTFEQAAGRTQGVVAVIDPRFLSRWSDERVVDRRKRDWQGLRGFYEFREAGFTTLEGSPKVRDASAFTGLTASLKQSLDPLGPQFCDAGLLSFLQVTTLVMSYESRDPCYRLATSGSVSSGKVRVSTPVPLADSGMFISGLSQQQVFRVDTDTGVVRCGLLTDPACFKTIGLQPSSGWSISTDKCTLPCVVRLTRNADAPDDQGVIVLPLNTDNALQIADQTGRSIPTTSHNGLLAIPANTPSDKITITTGTDWRMWLQVATAYFQYTILIPPIITITQRATKQRTRRDS